MLEEEEDCAEAAVYYKKAADLFDMDEYGKSQRSACILKYAEFSARYHNKLQEAIEVCAVVKCNTKLLCEAVFYGKTVLC